MSLLTDATARAAAVVSAVLALRPAPAPRAAMLRSGGAVGLGFVTFLAFGSIEQAVVCAIFTNLLCLSDKASHLGTRIWVQVLGASLSAGAGAIGVLLAGNDAMVLLATFAFALFAGFVHGTSPGVEAIPRYALVCFVLSAFLPVGHVGTLAAAAVGTALSIATILIDDHVRNGRRGIRIARMQAVVSYPGPRFSLVYGSAAAASLAIGLDWVDVRPYWVTITTLLVMQPDRRANTVRVLQRLVGTLAGVILAFLVVQAIPTDLRSHALLVVVVTLPFFWPLGFDRNYGLGVAILSTWVLILIDTAIPTDALVAPLFWARLSNTAIGCAVALGGSFVVQEARAEEAHGEIDQEIDEEAVAEDVPGAAG